MPQILSLKQRPDLYSAVLRLVEHSFGNMSHHKIEIDFYPLFQESNWEHCFIMIDDSGTLLAHLGVKTRQMIVGDELVPVALLGGIAVEEQERGRGNFRTLFQEVIKKYENLVAFFMLWSEKNTLYEKFGFYQIGEVFEGQFRGSNKGILTSSILDQLPSSEQDVIKNLYALTYEGKYACFKREHDDWNAIKKITSVHLLLVRDRAGKLINYAFKNKGMDLQNIIYEWHDMESLKSESLDMDSKIWSPVPLDNDFKNLRTFFLGLAKIGNFNLFQHFFNCIFKDRLHLQERKPLYKIPEHGEQEYSAQTILEMVFSNSLPNKWYIYVSGVDSI